MTRKTKTIREEAQKLVSELEKAKSKVEEINKLAELAADEEKDVLKQTAEKIEALCLENGLFCGMILTTPDLLAIVQLAIESKDQITIPFRLYFKE